MLAILENSPVTSLCPGSREVERRIRCRVLHDVRVSSHSGGPEARFDFERPEPLEEGQYFDAPKHPVKST